MTRISNRLLWKVGRRVTAFPDFAIKVALTEREIDLMDGDLAIPLLHVLDTLARGAGMDGGWCPDGQLVAILHQPAVDVDRVAIAQQRARVDQVA